MKALNSAEEENRRTHLMKDVRRVVIKIGSAVVATDSGLDQEMIQRLAGEVSMLRKRGIECIIVSSGAIAAGSGKVGLSQEMRSIPEKQAAAAVGQPGLLQAWEKAFGGNGDTVAQILLTRDDLSNRRRYLNARNTLFTLLRWKIVPIINENDTVMVEEIKFGDNDNLSSMIVSLIESNAYINLTQIDGLYDKDPRKHADAQFVQVVPKITKKVMDMATKEPGAFGRGGMHSKLSAARKAAMVGVPTVIANGRKKGVLKDILDGRPIGTLFLPDERSIGRRKYWIAFTTKSEGELIVDDGACWALTQRGKSLLPSGIRDVRGNFRIGAKVLLVGPDDKSIGVGLVNYPADEIRKIKGCKTDQIQEKLGYKFYDEVVHRDNLVISEDSSFCRMD